MPKNFKDWSKDEWYRTDDMKPTTEQLQLGCLQRIADGIEVMSKNYRNLLEENEKFYRWYKEEKAEKERIQRSIIAHKSNYTRLKNKLEAMKPNDS